MNAPPAAAAVLPSMLTLPALAEGEIYAGLCLGDGAWYHLVLLPAKAPKPCGWKKAIAWAKENGGELPTRREQAVLYGNLPGEFEKDWYWSSTPTAGADAYAWCQDFTTGGQYYDHKVNKLRARAVRRVAI